MCNPRGEGSTSLMNTFATQRYGDATRATNPSPAALYAYNNSVTRMTQYGGVHFYFSFDGFENVFNGNSLLYDSYHCYTHFI